MDLLKPYLMLASVAFALGFGGYVVAQAAGAPPAPLSDGIFASAPATLPWDISSRAI